MYIMIFDSIPSKALNSVLFYNYDGVFAGNVHQYCSDIVSGI